MRYCYQATMGGLCFKHQRETVNTIALRRAAGCGDARRLEVLIRSGASVNVADGCGNTALILAAHGGWDDCVLRLVRAGADLNRRNRYGHTALMKAVKNSHEQCVKLIIKAGADVNIADVYGYTALIKAAQNCNNNSEQMIHQLIQAGADLNAVNICGDTALFVALGKANYKCVKALIAEGADVSKTKENGTTALMVAVGGPDKLLDKDGQQTSKLKCVQLLLTVGASVNRTNEKSQNALEYYVETHEQVTVDIFMLLLAAGENIETKTIQKMVLDGNNNERIDLPECLNTENCKEISLKNTCREALRKHLISLDPHTHLFNRIPQLGLPTLITDYLLYSSSLDYSFG